MKSAEHCGIGLLDLSAQNEWYNRLTEHMCWSLGHQPYRNSKCLPAFECHSLLCPT